MISEKPILVVGAGIAGLATALALGRLGLPVVVAERRTKLEEEGAGVQISPNAARLLIDWGLGPALARRAVAPERVDIRRFAEPRAFASIPLLDAPTRYEAPFWTILRSDLHGALLDAVRGLGSARLLVGRRIVGFSDRTAGVVARLANEQDGEERLEVAAIIGADGANSSLRALAGDAAPPFFRNLEAWRALLPSEAAPPFMRQPAINLWMGPGRHLVHYPVAAGAAVNVVLIRGAATLREGWSSVGDPADIAADIAGLAAAVREPLRMVADWKVWSLADRDPPPLAKGRIALVGDAAHPVLPFLAQGAALAIEDAAVLAASIAAAHGDAAAGFVHYAKRRSRRIRRIQAESRANVRRYHMGGVFSRLRDFWIKRQGGEALRARFDWIYGWRP